MSNLSKYLPDQTFKTPLLKRVFDALISFVFSLTLLPIMLIIYFMMKAEGLIRPDTRGPLFYSEIRISQGRPFKLSKFRIFKTSIIDKTLIEKGFIHTKPLEQNLDNLTFTGQFLKKVYLDELPQIFSVLLGKMSLVGPRPWNLVDYNNEIAQGIYRKRIIKAGLTGLVQISKGDNDSHKNGVKLDNQYITFCQSNPPWKILLLDLKILAKSILVILKARGL